MTGCVDTYMILMDAENMGSRNMNVNLIKRFLKNLQMYYPER